MKRLKFIIKTCEDFRFGTVPYTEYNQRECFYFRALLDESGSPSVTKDGNIEWLVCHENFVRRNIKRCVNAYINEENKIVCKEGRKKYEKVYNDSKYKTLKDSLVLRKHEDRLVLNFQRDVSPEFKFKYNKKFASIKRFVLRKPNKSTKFYELDLVSSTQLGYDVYYWDLDNSCISEQGLYSQNNKTRLNIEMINMILDIFEELSQEKIKRPIL